MESSNFKFKYNFALILLLFISSLTAEAKRIGLAAKYVIPSFEESHIIKGQASQNALNPNSIKVLVWNLLKAERSNWSYDFSNMSRDKDILLLQEGYLNEITEYTFENLEAFRFDFGVSFLYKKDNNTPTGTVVGSKVHPIETGLVRTNDYEPFIKTPKTMTYGIYPIANTQENLLVISIHGMNFTRQFAFNNQINQALELIDNHQGPVVFAGDFNSRTKKRLSYLRTKMKVRGFKEATYTDDKRMKVFGNVLDHTFTRGLLVRDSKVLKHITSSDHKALELDLVLDQ